MKRDKVKKLVDKALCEVLEEDRKFKLEDDLKSDLGMDSLTIAVLIATIEDAACAMFDVSDLEPSELITVGDIYALARTVI